MTEIMPLADAVRWIGPHEASRTLGADDPHAYASEWCDLYGAQAHHHWPAWSSLEWHLSPDNEEVSPRVVLDALRTAPGHWREVLDTDPIPSWALLDARNEHNMTQADLAAALRCDARTIRRWEYGERLLSGPAAAAVELFFARLAER